MWIPGYWVCSWHTHRHIKTHTINNVLSVSSIWPYVPNCVALLVHKQNVAFLVNTCQPLSSDVCAAWKRAHSLPRRPETHNKTDNTLRALEFEQMQKPAGLDLSWRTHVYVHPELVFLTDISYAVQWVKRSLHGGPWCAAYKERHRTLVEANWKWSLCFLVCRMNKMHQTIHRLSVLLILNRVARVLEKISDAEPEFTWDFANLIFSSRSSGIMQPLESKREHRKRLVFWLCRTMICTMNRTATNSYFID